MEYITTKLNPMKSFPTYQFHAFAASETLITEDIFKICILETLRWLRSRLKKISKLPDEILTPEPEDYKKFSEESLHSFSFNIGLSVEVAYVEKRGIWSFQISESDMGANHDSKDARMPVNGRVFRTEMTFIKNNDSVEVGIRTICSEPYECDAPCEVFRPTVVKALANNPELSFKKCGFQLDGHTLLISSKSSIEYLGNMFEDEHMDMPIILICESGYEEKEEKEEKIEIVHKNVHKSLNTPFSLSLPEKSIDLSSPLEIKLSSDIPTSKLNKKIVSGEKREKVKPVNKIKKTPVRIKLPDFPY